MVEGLQRLGVGLSIDDYGTGWSSLARLQDMTVDELKLEYSLRGSPTIPDRSRSCVRPWRSRTASARPWSQRESKTPTPCLPCAFTAATSPKAMSTAPRYQLTNSTNG